MNIIVEALISIVVMFLTEVFGKETMERGVWVFPNDEEEEFLDDNQKLFRELEQLRQKYYRSYRFRKKVAPSVLFFALLSPPVTYLFLHFYAQQYRQYFLQDPVAIFWLSLIVSAFLVVFLTPWLRYPKEQYVIEYKNYLYPKIESLFGEDFHYSRNERYGGGGFGGSLYDYLFRRGNSRKEALLESKIVPGHRDYHADDVFEGTYKGVRLSLADVTLRTYAKKNEGATTVFQGLLIELDLDKTSFRSHTAVVHNKASFLDSTHDQLKGFKRIKVPAPEFERAFDIYGVDHVEARYLLDPAMMERLLNLYNEFSGQGMAVAFYKNKVLILISTSYNPFEPEGLFTPAGCEHSILRVKKEFEYVLSLIDRLKLYHPQRVHDSKMRQNESM